MAAEEGIPPAVKEALRLEAQERELDDEITVLEDTLKDRGWFTRNFFSGGDRAKLRGLKERQENTLENLAKALDKAEELGYSSEKTEARKPGKTPGVSAATMERLQAARERHRQQARDDLRPQGGQIGIGSRPKGDF